MGVFGLGREPGEEASEVRLVGAVSGESGGVGAHVVEVLWILCFSSDDKAKKRDQKEQGNDESEFRHHFLFSDPISFLLVCCTSI